MGGHRGVKAKQDGFVPALSDITTVETANVMVAIHHMKLCIVFSKRKNLKKKQKRKRFQNK